MSYQFHLDIQQIENEHELIRKAQADINNFEPLYNSYYERIFRFVYQRTDNKEEAADITSLVFLKAMTGLRQYKPKAVPFSAWLFRIAINEIGNHYAKIKRNRIVNLELSQLNDFLEDTNDELKEERIKSILNFLENLQEKDLILIEMRFFENRSFAEIAEILNITESNAKIKVYRILDRLKVTIK